MKRACLAMTALFLSVAVGLEVRAASTSKQSYCSGSCRRDSDCSGQCDKCWVIDLSQTSNGWCYDGF